MKYTSKQHGFTLVELAIVLVIIGLIVSGVLVGQDLIKAAELRSTVRQLQEYQVGVNTFIGKYSGVPGDIDGDKFGLTGGCDAGSGGTNGDGDEDGLIEDSAPGTGTARNKHAGEIACFWSNLTTPGKELIKGVYDGYTNATEDDATQNDVVGQNMPAMKFGSRGWSVFTDGTLNYFISGVVGAQADDDFDTAVVFVPLEAFNIDEKVDDGVPTAGDVQSRGAGTADPDAAATTNAGASASVCNNTTPNPDEYQMTATAAQCNLRFKMQTF